MSELENRLRSTLAMHADEAPQARDLAERIVVAATREPARRRREWRTWVLPLLSAGAVAAVAATVVGLSDSRHVAAPTPTVRPPAVSSPAPTAAPTTGTSRATMGEIVDLSFTGPEEIWSLRAPNWIGHSTDNGKTWTYTQVPDVRDVEHIRFANDKIGYVYGSALYMTTDAGKSWRTLIRDGDVQDVETLDGTTIVLTNPKQRLEVEVAAIGSRRFKEVTLPGGAASAYGASLARVRGVSVLKFGYAHAGAIEPTPMFTSTDGGYSWIEHDDPCLSLGRYAGWELTTGPDGSVSLLCETRSTDGSADSQQIITSTDGGRHFGSSPIYEMSASGGRGNLTTPNARTFLLWDGDGMLRSEDGGVSWRRVLTQQINSASPWCGFETTTVGHCLSGDGLTIWTTTDAGATWSARNVDQPPPNAATSSAALPPCGDELQINPLDDGAAAGTVGFRILFTNSSTSACTVQGYPTVTGVRPTVSVRQQVSAMTGGVQMIGGTPAGTKPPRLVVGPGQTVSATVEWSDVSNSDCLHPATTKQVEIGVPGRTPHLFDHGVGTCGVIVTPFVGGTTGSAGPHDPAVTISTCQNLQVNPVHDVGSSVELQLTSPSPQACWLRGAVSVVAYDATGAVITRVTSGSGEPAVAPLLQPEAIGSARLSFTAGGCMRRSAWITVAFGAGSPVRTTLSVPTCGLAVARARATY